MGNKYTHLTTQDPSDVLIQESQRMPHSCSAHCNLCTTKVVPAVHKDIISCLSVVRSGLVITGSRDNKMALHNMDSGECHMVWQGHMAEVTKTTYDNVIGNHILLSGSRDMTIKSWTFKSDKCVNTYKGHNLVITGLTTIQGEKFVSGSRDGTVKLWDLQQDTPINSKHINRNLVTHLEYNNQRNLLAQTSEDKELKLWDPRIMEPTIRFPKRNHILTHCDWSHEGNQIITSSSGCNGDGCEIAVWDVRNTKLLREIRGHEASVTCCSYINQQLLPTKKLILSCSADKTAKIWNVEDGTCLWTQELQGWGSELYSCTTIGDTHVIVSGARGLLINMRFETRAGRPFLHVHTVQK